MAWRPRSGVDPPLDGWIFERDGEVYALLESGRPRRPWPASVTEAELAVGTLVGAGLTNEEAASRRGTSTRTVANQLASLYRKLGVGSRAGLAAWLLGAPEEDP